MKRLAVLVVLGAAIGCGGSTSSGLEKSDAGSGGSTGGTSTGGASTGGSSTGGTSTGGTSTGGTSGGTGGVPSGGTGGIPSGGAGGSAGSATCSTLCQEIDAANCPNDEDYPACFAGCQIDIASYEGQCPTEVSSFFSCAMTNGQVTCDPDGDSKFLGCNAELVEFVQCTACIPSTSDDACEACQKQECCQELGAVYGNAEFAAYLDCVYACTTQACAQTCYQKFPGLTGPIGALVACQNGKCPSC